VAYVELRKMRRRLVHLRHTQFSLVQITDNTKIIGEGEWKSNPDFQLLASAIDGSS